MKKILVLNYEFPPLGGGAANATYYLLREFSSYPDLKIDLVTSSVDEFRVEKFSDNITIHYLDINKKGNLHYQSIKDLLIYSWRSCRYCKELKKRKNFDLVHAFFGIPCGYIAMKLKIPYIVSLRGSDVPFYNKRFYWLDLFVFKRLSKKIWENAKAVITNSQGLKDLALKSCLKQEQKIEVIYNGVDIKEFTPNECKKKNDKLVLISTGRLITRKGYSFLIEAIADLSTIELWLIGDGNLKEELENQAKNQNAQVKFLGKKNHEEIAGLLKQADVFVLPSLNEGMSNSILEAMACGLPIITTDTGGSVELIKDNGFIVEKKSPESIKEAVIKISNNAELINFMSKMSRNVAEKMSWTKVADSYIKKY